MPNNEIRVSMTTEILRTGEGIWVTAILSCEVICIYNRCLKPHGRQLSFKLDLDGEYYLDTPILNNYEINEGQFISNENMIGLVTSIRDPIDLEIPLNTICIENCTEICINCGLTLNEGSCSCKKICQL